jgi:hypothetical protein
MKDYSMYKYFKGEKENPFDAETQNSANRFWEYESMFEYKFYIDQEFKEKNKGESFNIWMEKLFIRLSDKYDCFDNGEHFRLLYDIG